jgi:hypothetical protein
MKNAFYFEKKRKIIPGERMGKVAAANKISPLRVCCRLFRKIEKQEYLFINRITFPLCSSQVLKLKLNDFKTSL